MKKSTSREFMDKVDSIIESNLANKNFSVEALADQLTLSYTQTYRKILQNTEVTPSIYIRNKRLHKSCSYLQQTDLSIYQISSLVGFRTQSYFATKFSEHYGVSPNKFRKIDT